MLSHKSHLIRNMKKKRKTFDSQKTVFVNEPDPSIPHHMILLVTLTGTKWTPLGELMVTWHQLVTDIVGGSSYPLACLTWGLRLRFLWVLPLIMWHCHGADPCVTARKGEELFEVRHLPDGHDSTISTRQQILTVPTQQHGLLGRTGQVVSLTLHLACYSTATDDNNLSAQHDAVETRKNIHSKKQQGFVYATSKWNCFLIVWQ